MKTAEPIRNKQQVENLLSYYKNKNQTRNHLLIAIGIYSGLRISDILNLSCDDVYDFKSKTIRKKIHLTEKKTGKSKIIPIHTEVRKALRAYLPDAKPNTPLILNPRTNKAISRIQAHRIINVAGKAINLSFAISAHSLRKTFGYHSWKDGISPTVIMEIFNHTSFATTRRYLGVSQDDKDVAYNSLCFVSADSIKISA